MKLNRIITLCAVTLALALSAGDLFAQQDNGGGNGGNGNGGNGGGQGGGGGGQRRNRQGGGQGGGNFDPAAMQQRALDNIKDQLEFTNDTDWSAVQPLVQKVLDTGRGVTTGLNFRALMGRNRGGQGGQGGQGGGGQGGQGGQGGGQGGGRGGMFGQPSPEQEALQNALDDNAPAGQIKDLLAKYKAAQQAKVAKFAAAQNDLKQVLNSKQEAQAYLLGLVN